MQKRKEQHAKHIAFRLQDKFLFYTSLQRITSAPLRFCTFALNVFSLFYLGVLLTSCELRYDPVRNRDVSDSPAAEAMQRFTYKEKVVPPFTTEDLSKEMSLEQLLNIALYNNPITRSSWNAARAAAFGYRASLSEEYPVITYIGNIQDQTSDGAIDISGAGGAVIGTGNTGGVTDTTTTTAAGGIPGSRGRAEHVASVFNELTLNYLLLDFGGRKGQEDLAYFMLIQANWQHNAAMQEVMLSVINNYTSYQSNIALVKASEENLKDAGVLLEAALKMRAAGLATLTDVLSAQSTVEQMRYALEQAVGARKNSLAQLLISLGLPPESALCIKELPDQLPVIEISGDVCSLIELAKEKNPNIGAAIALVHEQEADLEISYSSGMPTFNIVGNTSQVAFMHPQMRPIYNNSIALDVTAPLFAGFYYVNQQKQIRAQIAQAIANVDSTVATTISDVVTNYYAFTTAEAALPSSEASLEYSGRAFRGTLSQYKVGTSSIQDVVTSLTTLSNARSQLIATKNQWAASLANLAFSVGVLQSDGGRWQTHPERINLKYRDNK